MHPKSRFGQPGNPHKTILLGMLLVVLSASACIPVARAAVGSYMLSDPVPALLNGPKVTTDPNLLAQGGRAVRGVAADGVSEMVIAVSAGGVGQQFIFAFQPSAKGTESGTIRIVNSAVSVATQVFLSGTGT